jgi:hypothetical protein
MQIATEAVMRWFKTKDGTVYPDPQSAPELEQELAKLEAMRRTREDCDQALLAQARQTAHDNQLKFQRLQSAVRSIVLRLRVLDIEQLAKDVGEDGTVPLRLAIAELRALDKAYDGKEDPVWEDKYLTSATTGSYPYRQGMSNSSGGYVYSSSTSTAPYYSYGGKKP